MRIRLDIMNVKDVILGVTIVFNIVLITALVVNHEPEKNVPMTLFERQKAWVEMCAWEFRSRDLSATECIRNMPES